jgi:predicted ferric reductase
MHRFFAWMSLLTVIGHFISFTFDDFFHLTPLEALIPFSVSRNFHSAFGASLGWSVGFGSLALYGILTLVITSEFKGRFISLKKWRVLHYSSFLTYLLFLAHGIFAGSDTKTWWMIWIYSTSVVLVSALISFRIFGSLQKKKLPLIPPQKNIVPSQQEYVTSLINA